MACDQGNQSRKTCVGLGGFIKYFEASCNVIWKVLELIQQREIKPNKIRVALRDRRKGKDLGPSQFGVDLGSTT